MTGPDIDDFGSALNVSWCGRPPVSLEDVMAPYGTLAITESGGELYRTDSELEPFIDGGRLVTTDIDLTGEVPNVSDPRVDTLRVEDTSELRHVYRSSG